MNSIRLTAIFFICFSALPITGQVGRDTLRVFHHNDYPPLEYTTESGSSSGYDLEIFAAIAKAANLAYIAEGVTWDTLLSKVRTKQYDVLTGMYYSHSRNADLDLSIPILTISYSLFVRSGSGIKDLHDYNDKEVIILDGGISNQLVENIYSVKNVIQIKSLEKALMLLSTGNHNCAILPILHARYAIDLYNYDNLKSVGPKLLSRTLRIAVAKDDSLLMGKINEGFKEIVDDGTYKKIYNDWIEPFEERWISSRVVWSWAIGIVLIFIVLGTGGVVWTITLRRTVTIRTKELSDEIRVRKSAEKKMAVANNLKELLIDIITHDLRNPAAHIFSFSELARAEMPENELIKHINLSSERLIKVLENTTILAQATFGEKIPKERLKLNDILIEVVHDFESSLREADMTLEMDIPSGMVINANPLISEVFKNYFSNAIKYTRNGKKIILEVVKKDKSIQICVKDFGDTIQKEDRARIFERSIQLADGKKRGRGLGLAIVKRIAAAHNGEVWVEPNKPQGNSFCLRIPR